jgi:hypothetical protein
MATTLRQLKRDATSALKEPGRSDAGTAEPPADATIDALRDISSLIFECFMRLKLRQGQRTRQVNSKAAGDKTAAERDGWRCADAGGDNPYP